MVFNMVYWGGFAALASWGVPGGAPGWHSPALLAGIFALQAGSVILILNKFCRLSPSAAFCLGYYLIDNINFYFLVPLSPALLILPYANTLMYWGGVPLALLIYYFIVFAISNIFLIKIIRTRKLVASRIIVCVVFTVTALALNSFKVNHPPRIREAALFPRINLLHLTATVPAAQFKRVVAPALKKAPANILLITPQEFFAADPDKLPKAVLAQLTAQNKKLLLGVKRPINQKDYHSAAYYVTPAGIKFRHRQSLPFPGAAGRNGAVPPARSTPKIYPVLSAATVMPLIGFDLMLPLRNYRYALPDFYAVLGNLENYNQVTKKTMRVLAQALAATHHRPVFSTIIQGESAIINSEGQIKTIRTAAPRTATIISYDQ